MDNDSNQLDLSEEVTQALQGSPAASDETSFRRSESPEDEDIEIVNYQDYISLDVNIYDFSQVIFLEMKELYKPGENLKCQYKVTNALYPHPKDRVCLFRLGWISVHDCKTYMWAMPPKDYQAGTVFDSEITFSAAYVPHESSDNYYQFCYINHQDQIRGASTPFQFKEHGLDDETRNVSISAQLIEDLNERIDKLTGEKESLLREIKDKEGSLIECRRKIELLERQLEDHEELVALEQQQSQEVKQLKSEVEKLSRRVEDKQREKDEQAHQYELIIERTRAAELEHDEMYKTLVKQACTLQSEKTELSSELSAVVAEKESLEKLYKHLESENQDMGGKLDSLNDEYVEICRLMELRDDELEDMRGKLCQAERSSEQLQKELESQRSNIRSLKMEYEDCLAQKQQIPDQLAGPVYALKTALDHTQAKLEAANQKQEKYKTDLQYLRQQLTSKSDELVNERVFSADLLVRLDMAKLSYKMKYVEAGRYRKELKNVLKGDKQLYKRVVEDVDAQLKGIESEWKIPSNAEVVARDNSKRTLSLCNDATMDELIVARMVTSEDANETESVYLDVDAASATQTEPTMSVDHECSRDVKAAMSSAEKKQNYSDNTVSSGVGSVKEGGSQISPRWAEAQLQLQRELSNITPWKVHDVCLVTCADTLDRLACVAYIDRQSKSVDVMVAYQHPRGISALEVCMETQLVPEKSTFDKMRPYKREKVPREVWLKVCEYVFDGINAELGSGDVEHHQQQIPSDLLTPVAHSTLSNRGHSREQSAAVAQSVSVAGVGWGSGLSPIRLGEKVKKHVTAMASASVASTLLAPPHSSAGGATGNKNENEKLSEFPNNFTGSASPTLLSLSKQTDGSLYESTQDASLASVVEEMNKCLLCDQIFPKDLTPEVFNAHMEEHYGPSCPFCNKRFAKSKKGEVELQNHVNEHLREMGDM